MENPWDVVVVGAGAAGLSAALMLGRARRRTLVVDAGRPSNLPAHGIGGLLGHDGRPPAELYATGREELAAYPTVEVRAGEVIGGDRLDGGFELELADGARESTRRVLLASGLDYRVPELPGVAERWGRSVFHCPFCHGWEVREGALGVLDRGAAGAERALLLRMWSEDVTLFAGGPAELSTEDAERLGAAGVEIDERPPARLRGPGDALEAIVFADGTERACQGLLVPVVLAQRSDLAERLGASIAASGPEVLEVDEGFTTGVPGLSAAGDVTNRMPSVANAVAAGSSAAAMIVHGLALEARGRASAAHGAAEAHGPALAGAGAPGGR